MKIFVVDYHYKCIVAKSFHSGFHRYTQVIEMEWSFE